MVKCEICGNYYRKLTYHLIKTHNIGKDEYMKNYPDSPLVDEDTKRKMSENTTKRNKERWSSEYERTKQSERMRMINKKLWSDEDFRNKMKKVSSDNMKNLWNNDEFRNRMISILSENMRNYNLKYFSDINNRIKQSNIMRERSKELWSDEDFRNRMSKIFSERLKKQWEDPEYRQHISECLSKYMNEQWKDEEFREERSKKLSEALIELWKDKKFRNNVFSKLPSTGTNIEYYSNRFNKKFLFKSKCEFDFYKIMENDSSVKYIGYEEITIPKINGGSYVPDFLIVTNNEKYIVEIKYIDYPDKFVDKVVSALKYCYINDYKFCWIQRRDINNFTDIDDYVL